RAHWEIKAFPEQVSPNFGPLATRPSLLSPTPIASSERAAGAAPSPCRAGQSADAATRAGPDEAPRLRVSYRWGGAKTAEIAMGVADHSDLAGDAGRDERHCGDARKGEGQVPRLRQELAAGRAACLQMLPQRPAS